MTWSTRMPPAWRSTVADRKSTRLNSSHVRSSYAVFCLKKKREVDRLQPGPHHLHRLAAGERTPRVHVAALGEQPPPPLGAEPRARALGHARHSPPHYRP